MLELDAGQLDRLQRVRDDEVIDRPPDPERGGRGAQAPVAA
ncbi:hypothetical protein ACLBVB_32480, partial [Pseudomonas aeruginosa]